MLARLVEPVTEQSIPRTIFHERANEAESDGLFDNIDPKCVNDAFDCDWALCMLKPSFRKTIIAPCFGSEEQFLSTVLSDKYGIDLDMSESMYGGGKCNGSFDGSCNGSFDGSISCGGAGPTYGVSISRLIIFS